MCTGVSYLGRIAGVLAILGVTASVGDAAGVRNASDLVSSYAPLRPMVKTPGQMISPAAPPGHIVFKFRRGMTVHDGKSRLAAAGATTAVQILTAHGLTKSEPLIAGDAGQIRADRREIEDLTRMNLPDMSLYFRHAIADPSLAKQVIAELNARDEIEMAYFEPRPEVARYRSEPSRQASHTPYAAVTPLYEYSQDYIEGAPGGVGARAAWTLPGGDGTGPRVFDIEYGWQLTHEDLSKGATTIVIGENTADTDHGTAVLGEIAADRNSFGMTGIAHGADLGISSTATQSFSSAVFQAALRADSGDCILVELHSPGPRYNFEARDDQRGYIPMEYFQANFDAVLFAYARGLIVCAAAGNGEEDLDDPIYESKFDTTFRNSHAILCGAGHPPASAGVDRSKITYSNWGERVNLQGYGSHVHTLGYGYLYSGGSRDSWYTNIFDGTSAAAPIVAGTILSVSGVHQQMLGTVIDADSIRNLLVATGSPQQQPTLIRHIGPRPNLHAALDLVFDPIDTIWYDDIGLDPATRGAIPVTLSNSHPVAEIYLPFALTGDAEIRIDSLTRGPRTAHFGTLHTTYDNHWSGQMAYLLRADGGTPPLTAGKGVIAYLWVTAPGTTMPGQSVVVDSAWLGTSSHLRLISVFDDGYPDVFSSGQISITGLPCDCSLHGDLNGDGAIDVVDVTLAVDITFRNSPPAPDDPSCPHTTRADYDCDGEVNIIDVVKAVNTTFRNGPPPCNPCEI
jgi:hypothetical protein